MKAALIILVILFECLVLQSSSAREIKIPKFSKLFQKYSRDTPRVVNKLRRQLNLPKEKSAEDVIKYYNAYAKYAQTHVFYNTLNNPWNPFK